MWGQVGKSKLIGILIYFNGYVRYFVLRHSSNVGLIPAKNFIEICALFDQKYSLVYGFTAKGQINGKTDAVTGIAQLVATALVPQDFAEGYENHVRQVIFKMRVSGIPTLTFGTTEGPYYNRWINESDHFQLSRPQSSFVFGILSQDKPEVFDPLYAQRMGTLKAKLTKVSASRAKDNLRKIQSQLKTLGLFTAQPKVLVSFAGDVFIQNVEDFRFYKSLLDENPSTSFQEIFTALDSIE